MDSYGVIRYIDTLGRVTIPKPFRDALNMMCGDGVEVCHVDNGILIKPVAKDGNKDAD